MPTPHILKETRFDAVAVDEEENSGSVTYEIGVGAQKFEVRIFDDEPGGAIISKPGDAHALGEARELIDFIVSVLGREIIQVYSTVGGRYRTIDSRTLEFEKY